MKAEDIIEGLNRHIEQKRKELNINVRGFLVLQKTIETLPTFKVYKQYNYTVWLILNRKKYRAFTINDVTRVINGKEDDEIFIMNVLLSTKLFNWVGTESYNRFIRGDYHEFINE